MALILLLNPNFCNSIIYNMSFTHSLCSDIIHLRKIIAFPARPRKTILEKL
jgi:hypothetical protein